MQVLVTHLGQGLPIRYFCSDESRFGLKTLCSRVITLMGVKPVAPVQWSRANFWLYGAVEPATGEHFFYEFSHLDTACFQHFIDLFAAAFPDSLNLLQLDQASCHIATQLIWPQNVIPIFQPAHSQATFWGEDSPQKLAPELNPIERLWQDIKKHVHWQEF